MAVNGPVASSSCREGINQSNRSSRVIAPRRVAMRAREGDENVVDDDDEEEDPRDGALRLRRDDAAEDLRERRARRLRWRARA